jgi:hypothetical protein
LESYVIDEIKKSDLADLQPGPVLFHSGYLTIDIIARPTEAFLKSKGLTTDEGEEEYYFFKLPNYEVKSSYNQDLFSVILDLDSSAKLEQKGQEFKDAFLASDAEKVSFLFSDFFSAISFYQKTTNEKTFHAFIQLILTTLGFNVYTELAGSEGRLDLCLELPQKVFLIIELKYCPHSTLTKEEENNILTVAIMDKLTIDEINHILALEATKKMNPFELKNILFEHSQKNRTENEKNKLLADAARKKLPLAKINQIFASKAKIQLPPSEVYRLLDEATLSSASSVEDIDATLSKAAQKALNDIKARDYHGIVKLKAAKIIDLGLAIYSNGAKIKAAFGSKNPSVSPSDC